MSIGDEFIAAVKAIDLSACARAGMDKFMEIMADKVPQGQSPYGGTWVDNYNKRYAAKVGKSAGGPVNLDMGMKRYERAFNETIIDENSVTREYDQAYKDVFNAHQTGIYNKSTATKPRQLIPQDESEVPDEVYLIMIDEFAKRLEF